MSHERIENFISGKYEKSFSYDFSLAWGVLYPDEGGHRKETPSHSTRIAPLFSDGVAHCRPSRRRIFLRFPFRDTRRKSAPFREGISSRGRSVRDGKSRRTTRRVVGTQYFCGSLAVAFRDFLSS